MPALSLLIRRLLSSILASLTAKMDMLTLFTVLSAILWLMIPIGYEFNIQNPLYPILSDKTDWNAFVIVWPIGAVLGSVLSIWLRSIQKKLSTFTIPCSLFVIGGVITAITDGRVSTIGRFLFAFGSGIVMCILPTYVLEISDHEIPHPFIGCAMNSAFWLGASFASGLGLDTVLGTVNFWPYLAMIPSFLACMTLVLSPLFPRVYCNRMIPESRSLIGPKSVRISNRLSKNRLSKCAGFGTISIFTGPTLMFALTRSILTSILEYSDHVAGAIESCVAVIYACFSILSIVIFYFVDWKKSIFYASILSALSMLVSIAFVILAQYCAIDAIAAKMGFLWSFLICAGSYQTVIAPITYTVPEIFCENRYKSHGYAVINAAVWFGYLIWVLIFEKSAENVGGWSLIPFVFSGIAMCAFAFVYLKDDRDQCCIDNRLECDQRSDDHEITVVDYGTF